MGNIQCCNPQTIKKVDQQQQVYQDNINLSYALQLIQQVYDTSFMDFRKDMGISNYSGINVQNLSQLYRFIELIKNDEQNTNSNRSQMSRRDNRTGKLERNQSQNQMQLKCLDEFNVQKIKKGLFQLKRNTKKNVRSLDVTADRNYHNQVQLPYFLPWFSIHSALVCVYIGEWRFENHHLMINVPYGIGRLYFNNQIWQGSIKTNIERLIVMHKQQVEIMHQKLRNPKVALKQKVRILKSTLGIELNGYGRKFSKDQEYMGTFQKNRLNGKGIYKNFIHEYGYEGDWVNDIKEGKGMQKTKLTYYEGTFINNKKQGQGYLNFYISTKQQKERQMQLKRFQQLNQKDVEYKQMKDRVNTELMLQEISDKLVREVINANIKNYKGQQLLTFYRKAPKFGQSAQTAISSDVFIANLKYQQGAKSCFLQKYTGQFQKDLFEGKGTYQWAKGNFYSGEWSQGKMSGLGKFYWKQGYSYHGQYRNDLKHGKGQMKWDPFRRYRGHWAFGSKHGYGQQIRVQMRNKNIGVSIKSGLWRENTLAKRDTYWQKFFPLPVNYKYKRILLNNIGYYYQLEKDGELEIKIIQSEAENYYKIPCIYCGQYFKMTQQFQSEIYAINKQGANESQLQPDVCNDCKERKMQIERQKY